MPKYVYGATLMQLLWNQNKKCINHALCKCCTYLLLLKYTYEYVKCALHIKFIDIFVLFFFFVF